MLRIPATILTGFLGAGKSTLLRRVLTETHGQKIAVIENEFGEENIDSEIIFSGGTEHIVKMSNGCICCSIREDLRATLWDLSEQRRSGVLAFDKVIIETTGLADPGPITQTFFLDEAMAARYQPDAILTMVDAVHAMEQFDARGEARRQVGFADQLFISKADLVTPDRIEALSARLSQMNPHAPQSLTPFGAVNLDKVFGVGGFNLDSQLAFGDETPGHDGLSCADPLHSHALHHHDDVKSFVFRSPRALHAERFSQFMNAVVTSHGARLLRYKGILNINGHARKVVLQGVHQLMSHDLGNPWASDEPRISKLVFIGIELPREQLMRSLQLCLV